MTIETDWYRVAKRYTGTREIPGPTHNPKIITWLRNLKAWWSEDETPWCGTFVAHCMQEAGLPYPQHWYRAKGWSEYGSNLAPDRLALGAILVFDRKGGGHVCFYAGEDETHYHCLGGNQSNGVNVMRLEKSRLVASRWPKGIPVLGGPVRLAANRAQVSRNEA